MLIRTLDGDVSVCFAMGLGDRQIDSVRFFRGLSEEMLGVNVFGDHE